MIRQPAGLRGSVTRRWGQAYEKKKHHSTVWRKCWASDSCFRCRRRCWGGRRLSDSPVRLKDREITSYLFWMFGGKCFVDFCVWCLCGPKSTILFLILIHLNGMCHFVLLYTTKKIILSKHAVLFSSTIM